MRDLDARASAEAAAAEASAQGAGGLAAQVAEACATLGAGLVERDTEARGARARAQAAFGSRLTALAPADRSRSVCCCLLCCAVSTSCCLESLAPPRASWVGA